MDGKIFYFAEMANNSNEILCVILFCAAMLIVNAFLVLPNGNTVLRMALAGAEPQEIVNLIKEAIMKWGG